MSNDWICSNGMRSAADSFQTCRLLHSQRRSNVSFRSKIVVLTCESIGRCQEQHVSFQINPTEKRKNLK